MVQCSAPRCSSSSTKGYLLQRFPRDAERRARWATNVQKTNWEPTNNSYVCEIHFDNDQWELKRLDRLKWNATPTIFHKRFEYAKRNEEARARELRSIQLDMPCAMSQNHPDNRLVYILKIDDCLTGMIDSIDTNERTELSLVRTASESGDVVRCNERVELASEIQGDSEKDAIIAGLRKEIAKKDFCLSKYEKIICQMNSHLEKFKGRLKFLRDFWERYKFSLRKVKKVHKSAVHG